MNIRIVGQFTTGDIFLKKFIGHTLHHHHALKMIVLEGTVYDNVAENPLVCTEKVHMLQEGVGVYVPNSEDSICGVKSTQQLMNNNSTLSLDEREAIRMAEEEFLTPAFTNPFVQDGNRASKTSPTIIHPLSAFTSQGSVSSGSHRGNNDERLISVLPINASTEPSANPPSEHHSQQRISDSHVAPPIEIMPIESRTRGNFGFEKPRFRANIVENKTIEENATSTQQPNVNDPFSVDNPNVIHPFPVPFLSRPPKIFSAYLVTTTPNTLPPSIVIAQDSAELNSAENTIVETQGRKFEQIALETRTPIPKQAQEIREQFPFDIDSTERLERLAAPSVIIIMCLSTVAIVMGAVFVGLCIAKHRRMQRFGSSSASSAAAMRTNAYVNAQAAQMNMLYGSVHRNRSGNTAMSRLDDPQTWIYAPGSYNNSYYK